MFNVTDTPALLTGDQLVVLDPLALHALGGKRKCFLDASFRGYQGALEPFRVIPGQGNLHADLAIQKEGKWKMRFLRDPLVAKFQGCLPSHLFLLFFSYCFFSFKR